MDRVALCLPESVRERVAAQLERHGYGLAGAFGGCGELSSALFDGVDVAIVAAQPRYLDRAVVETADAQGVRLVAVVEGDADRRYAAALGLYEVIDVEASFAEVEASMARREAPAAAESTPTPISAPGGRVIAVWGPVGAPGRTTLAISIAAEFAARGLTVVLADVDTHGGAVAPALGLLDESPGFAAACRLAGTGALDLAELDRIAERYSSPRGSFRVLTGIGRPSRWPELSSDRVTATIAACRTWADFTVLDTGASLENDEEITSDLFAPRRNAATISALRAADRVVAVGSADPVGMSRFFRAWVDVVEVVDPERLVVVMNRLRSSAVGPNPLSQVASTLERFGGIRASQLIPHDRSALDSAILTGRTVHDAAPKSPVRQAIAELVGAHLIGTALLPAHLQPAVALSRRGRRATATP